MDYIKEVVALKSGDFNVPDDADLVHAIIGISTEAGELIDQLDDVMFMDKKPDVVNVKEELGDLLWYMALLCYSLECTFDEFMESVESLLNDVANIRNQVGYKHPVFAHSTLMIAAAAGRLMDQLKRATFYGSAIDNGILRRELNQMLWQIAIMCVDMDCTVEELQQMNIDKLHKRYKKGKFSQEDAVNRDTAAEREVLEKYVNDQD